MGAFHKGRRPGHHPEKTLESFMCGIVGAVSTRNIVPLLVQGLQRLEYRGYDSCGIAIHAAGAPGTGGLPVSYTHLTLPTNREE